MALITLDLSDEAMARLKEAAARWGLSEGAVVEQALAAADADAAWLTTFVTEAEADFEAGRTFSHEEVMARADALLAAERERQRG